MSFAFEVVNLSGKAVELSGLAVRYWYQDKGEGLGASPTIDIYYAGVGKENVTSAISAVTSPLAGADHYLQLTLSAGRLLAKGDSSGGDKTRLSGSVHTADYQGAVVDVSNDYSYNGGSEGYDQRITIHDKSGNLIAGTPPDGSSTPEPSKDPVDAGAIDGSPSD